MIFKKAAGHLDLCVDKRMEKRIILLPENCDRPNLRTRECTAGMLPAGSRYLPSLHSPPLPIAQGLLNHSQRQEFSQEVD